MDIQIDKSYENEPLLIRYAALLFNNIKDKNINGERLVEILCISHHSYK